MTPNFLFFLKFFRPNPTFAFNIKNVFFFENTTILSPKNIDYPKKG